ALSASTGPVNSSIARLGISTRGARGAGCMLTQPSQMAAYPWAGVAVQEPRTVSAARMGSAGALPGGLPASGPEESGRAIRTYTSKPGGPYRTRSRQATSDRSNHRAGDASAAGPISVTLLSVVER